MRKGLRIARDVRSAYARPMQTLLERLHQTARAAEATVVLAEGDDDRVVAAAAKAHATGLCRPVLIGDPEAVTAAAQRAGVAIEVPILCPEDDPNLDAMADDLVVRLDQRSIPHGGNDAVRAQARDRLFYANLLVRHGRADGAIMGAVATTGDTLRAALRVIGVDPRYKVVTSCFLMILPDERALIYADCGVIPTPNAEQLADIAMQAAAAYRLLVGDAPQVALLGFSTLGSADHPALTHVRDAVASLTRRRADGHVDFDFDGELQVDAALVDAVATRKAPASPVAGRANVLIFPDLNSGNIAYKLTERLAGARAIGPLLRGLDHPIHDLSRGCSVTDSLDTLAITAVEAAQRRQE